MRDYLCTLNNEKIHFKLIYFDIEISRFILPFSRSTTQFMGILTPNLFSSKIAFFFTQNSFLLSRTVTTMVYDVYDEKKFPAGHSAEHRRVFSGKAVFEGRLIFSEIPLFAPVFA